MPRTLQEILNQQDELARRFEDHEPDPADRRDPAPLAAMRKAMAKRAQAERDLLDAVTAARDAGYSWAAIGAIVGTSGEAARQRYGRHAHM
ncbi:hypothetical protein FHU38_003869 [Saccharomonospora amisosensis]|uniref:Transcriptional regulator n=1 Tax=Saccharomonospora amisosensis TaxID=1128677 RepID=A0A7X5ZSN0_9PSEU|nr:hypothetical protein [Saccharomonospora amisosensis]NIJ13525.1 hypothetical protein [Saccharomonospora amisosensis]